MPFELEAMLLRRAVKAQLLDPEKGTAALTVYRQLQGMGAQFGFGEFLVQQGLLSRMALEALQKEDQPPPRAISQVGDFQLLELIGEGQNGAVFKAMQLSLQRPVAVKILNASIAADPECLRRFQAEARVTAKLNHPNIVQGIDVGTDQGLHYFAMELVEGGTVRQLLESSGDRLPEWTALELVRQTALALRAAHAAGMIHGDIKPDNLLLTPQGIVKLVDLGTYKAIAAHRAQLHGEFWASPPYVAPEVIEGIENDPRSDLYSLGAMFFELLTGQPPFIAGTPEQIMQMHLSAPIPSVRSLRPDVRTESVSLTQWLLAKNPTQRPISADALLPQVERIQTLLNPPIPETVEPQPRRTDSGIRRAVLGNTRPASPRRPGTGGAKPMRGYTRTNLRRPPQSGRR